MSLESKKNETELDIEELKTLLESAKRKKVKDLLGINLRKLETELINLKEEIGRTETRLKASNEDKPETKPEVKRAPESQIKDYSWDQSENYVKLYLTGLSNLATINQDNIKVTFTDQSLNIRIENLNGKTLLFNINKTCHKISPSKSHFKVKSDYLVVFLGKHNPGSSWSHITYAEKCAADAKKSVDTKMDESGDPSAGLMNMMKKLYDEGDDEMKRTIAKAWTEGQQKKNPEFDL